MNKQLYLPESLYGIDPAMSYEKLRIFQKNSSSITARIVRLDSTSNSFEVYIGNGMFGIMAFEDSTIYPLYKETGEISPNLYQLVGNTIQAKILSVDTNTIHLSRKENMLEALEYFKTQVSVPFAKITNFSQYSAFFDIGGGIIGRCFEKDFSRIVFKHSKDIGLKVNDIIPIDIINFWKETNLFSLSRVNTLPNSEKILNVGDIVWCKVFNKLDSSKNTNGYIVLIEPAKISGVVDVSPDIELTYGETISAVVTGFKEKGPHLGIVKKVL